MYDNRDHGITCQSEVIIEDNDIVGNQRSAIQLDKNLFIKVCIIFHKNVLQIPSSLGLLSHEITNIDKRQ